MDPLHIRKVRARIGRCSGGVHFVLEGMVDPPDNPTAALPDLAAPTGKSVKEAIRCGSMQAHADKAKLSAAQIGSHIATIFRKDPHKTWTSAKSDQLAEWLSLPVRKRAVAKASSSMEKVPSSSSSSSSSDDAVDSLTTQTGNLCIEVGTQTDLCELGTCDCDLPRFGW